MRFRSVLASRLEEQMSSTRRIECPSADAVILRG